MLSLMVAHGRDRVIGKDNQMPWHLPEELAYFKRTTMGKPIVMGRKTFESIGRPLPGRLNIVITRNSAYVVPEGVIVVSSIDEAIKAVEGEKEIMVIGGAQIYEATIEKADRLYITLIDASYEGDVFFPYYALEQYNEIERSATYFTDDNVPYVSVVYERIR